MELKTCPKCNHLLPIDKFSYKDKAKGKRHVYCKLCTSVIRRGSYVNNREYYKADAMNRKKVVVAANKLRILDYLSSKACVDCSEADVRVLEFDHVRGEKRLGVSQLISRGASWTTIENEILKCEIRCANCHRKRTTQVLGWYRGLMFSTDVAKEDID